MLIVDIILGLLILLILLFMVTVMMHWSVGVPFVPTPPHIVERMIEMAELTGHETVFDLGAGDARIVCAVVRKHPGVTAIGCEIVPTVWMFGKLRCMLTAPRVAFLRRDAFAMDLRSADRVFLYLFPTMLERLAKKFDDELKPGTIVISHTFAIPGRTPYRRETVRGYAGEATLFAYRW